MKSLKTKAKKIAAFNTEAARLGVSLPTNFYNLFYLQEYAGQTHPELAGKVNPLSNPAYVVQLYAKDPKQFLTTAVRNAAYNYGYMALGAAPDNGAYLTAKNNFKIAVTAAVQGGVPIPQIQSAAESGSSAYSDWLGGPDPLTQVGAIAMPIAFAFALPGIGQSIGANLLSSGVLAAGTSTATATAIGTAMASIAVQAGQGIPLETAIKNAGVNLIVQTGATSAATQLNDVIKNPAVTDALVSAGASAVKTIASGGSAEDIKRNIVGAVAGSATSSATGSNVVGSTVGGAVTGGVTGALTGAASALGQDAAKDTSTTTTTTDATSADPGIKVAGGDDATALNMASISAMPEMLGKAGETASPITAKTEEGVTFYERKISGTTPDGKPYEYIATYDPTAPTNQQVTYLTGSSDTATATATTVRPNFSTTDTTTSGGYTPTITTTPSNVVSTGGTSTTGGTDKAILDLISGTTTGGGPTTDANYPSFVSSDTAGNARANILLDEIRSSLAGTGAGSDQAAIDAQNTGSTAVDTGAGVVTTPVTDTTATDAAATKKGILNAKTKAWTTLAKSIGDSLSNPITTTKVDTAPSTTGMSTTKTKIADAKARADAALLGLSKPVTDITSVGTDTTTGATTNTGTTTSTGAGAGAGATTGLPDTTGTTTTTVGTDTGAGAGTGTGTDKAILDLISTDKTTGTGTATDTGTGTTAVDTGTSTDASTGAITDAATDTTDTTDTATEDTTTKPADKYKPNLRIYGGTTPSTLSQSLGTGGTYSTGVATTGLTGSRGAGEIESKETGKKRKNVWNEASLRLKDALGV